MPLFDTEPPQTQINQVSEVNKKNAHMQSKIGSLHLLPAELLSLSAIKNKKLEYLFSCYVHKKITL